MHRERGVGATDVPLHWTRAYGWFEYMCCHQKTGKLENRKWQTVHGKLETLSRPVVVKQLPGPSLPKTDGTV